MVVRSDTGSHGLNEYIRIHVDKFAISASVGVRVYKWVEKFDLLGPTPWVEGAWSTSKLLVSPPCRIWSL